MSLDLLQMEAMSPTTPSEALSPDTGPIELETQVQTSEMVRLPIGETQASLAEDRLEDSSQIQTSPAQQNWIYYFISWVMLFTSFAVIIAGITSRHEDGWGSAFIFCYSCWTFAVSICLYLNLSKPDVFLKQCASHLACCAVTLYFFAAALHITSTDLPMYIPIGVNLGLLLSIGLQQMSLPTKMQILSYLGLGYTYEVAQQPSILPLIEPRSQLPRSRVDGAV